MLNVRIPTLEKCNAPAVVQELLESPNGLIFTCGPSGSGKTTTLLSMVDWLNENKALHICTIENPIAYPILPKKSVVQQREVLSDVPTMAAGVYASMRQDPDVLFVGEIDSFETLAACLHAAETGHLVLVQAHGLGPTDTINRLMGVVPDSHQSSIRQRFGEALRGLIFQMLAPNASGKGRTAVHEVLVGDQRMAQAIALGDERTTYKGGEGSVSMDDELRKLEESGTISAESAQLLKDARRA